MADDLSPTPSPTIAMKAVRTVVNPGGAIGKTGRGIVGALVIAADVVFVFLHPISGVYDLGQRVALGILGLALIDGEAAVARIVAAVKGTASL